MSEKKEREDLPESISIPQAELSSSPVVVVPLLLIFTVISGMFMAKSPPHPVFESPWNLAIASLALVVVTVVRRRYDGWRLEGGSLHVSRGKIHRSYRLSDVRSVSTRRFFSGFASVSQIEDGICRKKFMWLCREARLKMRNGDSTIAVSWSRDPQFADMVKKFQQAAQTHKVAIDIRCETESSPAQQAPAPGPGSPAF